MGPFKRPAASSSAAPAAKRPAAAPGALATPQPNKWEELFPPVPPLGRKLRVALPCVGIDGCGTALRVLQVPHVANNVRDLEARYAGYLDAHLEMDEQRKPRLGACGELLKQDLQDLERPVDLLVAGPPCPPWAGQGKKEGTADRRAWVYVQVLRFVVALVKCNDLFGVLLENVKGILAAVTPEIGSFMDRVLAVLEAEVPEMHWRIQVLQATAENPGLSLRRQEDRGELRARCSASAGPSQPASVPQGEGALCADQELDCEHAEELEGQSAP